MSSAHVLYITCRTEPKVGARKLELEPFQMSSQVEVQVESRDQGPTAVPRAAGERESNLESRRIRVAAISRRRCCRDSPVLHCGTVEGLHPRESQERLKKKAAS